MILKSEMYNYHRFDLTRQAGFIVTIYDEDGLRLAATPPLPTPEQALAEARKIVDKITRQVTRSTIRADGGISKARDPRFDSQTRPHI